MTQQNRTPASKARASAPQGERTNTPGKAEGQKPADNTPPQQPSTSRDFFRSQLTGLAYLNSIREVQPRKGKPYIAVYVKLLQGEVGAQDDGQHLRLNANVFGENLKQILTPYVGTSATVKAVIALSDLKLDTYVRKEDQSVVPCMYARLFGIRKLWVDGAEVYAQPQHDADREAA